MSESLNSQYNEIHQLVAKGKYWDAGHLVKSASLNGQMTDDEISSIIVALAHSGEEFKLRETIEKKIEYIASKEEIVFKIINAAKWSHNSLDAVRYLVDLIFASGQKVSNRISKKIAVQEVRYGGDRLNKLNLSEADYKEICEYKQYVADEPAEYHIHKAQDLLNSSRGVDFSGLGSMIMHAIAERKPFSFLRMGDGEGRFVSDISKYPIHEAESCEIAKRIWFWNSRVFPSKLFFDQLRASYISADVVGVNPPFRIELELRNLPIGYIGVTMGNKFIIDNLNQSNSRLTENWALQLLEKKGFFADLCQTAPDITLICPHASIKSFFLNKYNKSVDHIQIPAEDNPYEKISSINDPHYPDVFNRTIERIKESRSGVYLIAGGVYAKIYCEAARRSGAVAIDVGSLMDAWLNINSRPAE